MLVGPGFAPVTPRWRQSEHRKNSIMRSMKAAMLGAGMLALAAAGCTHAPGPHAGMKMADDHAMGACMQKSHSDMMKDTDCKAMMAKMQMSEADMQAMHACHAMDHAAMMKDEKCAAMMAKHHEMMDHKAEH